MKIGDIAMPDEIVDLTKNRPSEAFSKFQPSDVVLIAVTGGVGYLAKEAYKHFSLARRV
jgi:hypothetical protein